MRGLFWWDMNAKQRLALSALIATVFYGGWSYFANSLVSDDTALVLRSALVQGVYSGSITLMFTWLLEGAYKRVGARHFSFAFVVPLVCLAHSPSEHAYRIRQSFNTALERSASWFKGTCWPGAILAPLLPLLVQSLLVIGVNVVNQTPNLALTVAPSIFFSGLYGYMYTFALYKKYQKEQQTQAASQPL